MGNLLGLSHSKACFGIGQLSVSTMALVGVGGSTDKVWLCIDRYVVFRAKNTMTGIEDPWFRVDNFFLMLINLREYGLKVSV